MIAVNFLLYNTTQPKSKYGYMDKKFIHSQVEERIYEFWEENSLLKAKNGKPFTILMPPPNANASLHAGHGMYTVEEILIRYKRLRGFSSLWIPGKEVFSLSTKMFWRRYWELLQKWRKRDIFIKMNILLIIVPIVEHHCQNLRQYMWNAKIPFIILNTDRLF